MSFGKVKISDTKFTNRYFVDVQLSIQLAKIIFYLALLLPFNVLAQEKDNTAPIDSPGYTSQLEISAYKGYIMMHGEGIGHLIKSHPHGFRVSYLRNTYGQRYWEQAFGYPDVGFSFCYQDYLNPVLGQSMAVETFLNLYLYRGKLSSLTGALGTGIAYHTHPHDQKDNNSNVALGSSFSFALYTALKYQLRITDYLSGGIFIHMDHFSNGGIRKPNSGINIVQTDLSLKFDLHAEKPEFKRWSKQSLSDRSLYFTLLPSFSFKEIGRGGGVMHPCYNLNLAVNKPLSVFSTINLGMDGYYDIAMKKWIVEENSENQADFKSAAVTLGHQLMIGKVSFLTQFGYYFYRPYRRISSDLYQRYGLRVHVHPHIAASASMKTFLGKAEQVEWGLLFSL